MKWINIENKLPEEHEECLVSFNILPDDPQCGVCFNLTTFSGGKFYSFEREKIIDTVTHWMPLPKAPK